jgi:hypothetical protein
MTMILTRLTGRFLFKSQRPTYYRETKGESNKDAF